MTKIRTLALLGCLGLAGCGFSPVYGSHGTTDDNTPVAVALNDISIENIPDRDGQVLRNYLIDRMYGKNRPEHPAYKLTVKLHFTEASLGILANATATRALLTMEGDYTLSDAKDNEMVSGHARSVASFDLLDQIYGSVVARQNAHERTLHEISEQITNRISLYFSESK